MKQTMLMKKLLVQVVEMLLRQPRINLLESKRDLGLFLPKQRERETLLLSEIGKMQAKMMKMRSHVNYHQRNTSISWDHWTLSGG
jgi:hypothetical protein